MKAGLRLYGTSACHLCEQAGELLDRLGLGYDRIDIADDSELMERYGTRIPVLHCPVSGEELAWPFDAPAVRAFVLLRR